MKGSYNNIIFFVCLIATLLACKDETSKLWTEVSFTARDYYTKEAFMDARLVFDERRPYHLVPETNNLIDTVFSLTPLVTQYKAKKQADWQYDYYIEYDKEKYWLINGQEYFYEVPKGETSDYNFEFTQIAKLTIKVSNIDCGLDSEDYARIDVKNNFSEDDNHIPYFNTFWVNGCITDSIVFEMEIPTGIYYIDYKGYHWPGGSDYGEDTLDLMLPGDYVYHFQY